MIGDIVHGYRILEKIGEGGMGVVYKAEDIILERIVALKVLSEKLHKKPKAKQRFIRGAQAVARLEHPNICTIYEIGEFEERHFLSMAYIEGLSLHDKLQPGPLSIGEALDIALQTAEGLKAAHKNDIIHRDIKSANIMINTEGVVKILDFGLAKLVGKENITKPHAILGTLAYMSPEQAIGRPVDFRTDIWSFGVVMYKMLAGQRPFQGRNAAEMIKSILDDTPERIRTLRPDVPEELEYSVHKMMERGRQLRHKSMEEVIKDLKRVQTH